MDNKPKPAVVFAASIAIALGIGGLSALLTAENMQLYSQIIAPPLAPPSWLFPVVWTVLYILMGISAGLIYLNRSREPDGKHQEHVAERIPYRPPPFIGKEHARQVVEADPGT